MQSKSHAALVGGQFGSQAEAYLKSPVHAEGPDLQAIAAIAAANPGARVLDLGCGGGHVTFTAAPHVAEVTAYDLSPEMLKVVADAARKRGLGNVATREGVAERLPFEDGSFDIVFSRYSAHHWHDFEAGLREAARVLKPGGIAGFVDTVSPGVPLLDTYLQAVELLRDPSHVRDYSRAEWEAALARAGLRPGTVRMHRVHLEFSSWIARMRTPAVQADAIRAIQRAMADSVTRHFAIEADGSYTIDVAFFEAAR